MNQRRKTSSKWLVLIAPLIIISSTAILFIVGDSLAGTTQPIPFDNIIDMAFSPNSEYLSVLHRVESDEYACRATVLQMPDRKFVFETSGDDNGHRITWNLDGTVLYIANVHGSLWKTANWSRIPTTRFSPSHGDIISGLSFDRYDNLYWISYVLGGALSAATAPNSLRVTWNATDVENLNSGYYVVFQQFEPGDVTAVSLDEQATRVAVSPRDRFGEGLSKPVIRVFLVEPHSSPKPELMNEYEIPLSNWDDNYVKVKLTPDGQYLGYVDNNGFQLVQLKEEGTIADVHTAAVRAGDAADLKNYLKTKLVSKNQLMNVSQNGTLIAYKLPNRIEVFHIPSKRIIHSVKIFPGKYYAFALEPAGHYLAVYNHVQKQLRFHAIAQP